jgi:hypothetical protein
VLKRLAALIVLGIACGPALAQVPAGGERFCLAPQGDASPPPQHCTFATLADCEAAKISEAERCVPSLYLTFPQSRDKPQLPPELRQ